MLHVDCSTRSDPIGFRRLTFRSPTAAHASDHVLRQSSNNPPGFWQHCNICEPPGYVQTLGCNTRHFVYRLTVGGTLRANPKSFKFFNYATQLTTTWQWWLRHLAWPPSPDGGNRAQQIAGNPSSIHAFICKLTMLELGCKRVVAARVRPEIRSFLAKHREAFLKV